LASSASAASFEIVPGSFAVRALDAEGQQETRAGSHPDVLQIDFGLKAEGTSAGEFAVEMPPGLDGLPGSVPQCRRELVEKEEECPPESQVGATTLQFSGGGSVTLPTFQVEPGPGEIIAVASSPGVGSSLKLELRPDLGITFTAGDLPEASVSGGRIELWGVPADHQSATSIPRRPLLTLPTRCGPMAFGFRARSREPGAAWLSAGTDAESPLSGCQELAFEPKLAVQFDNPRADSPTGVRIDLSLPEHTGPDELAVAQLENAEVLLPEGLTISPGGVVGRDVCSSAQFGLGQQTRASCPASSRIGSLQLTSSLASEPLTGDLYLGEGTPQQRLRLFVAATAPGETVIKFATAMGIASATGRLSTVLRELPQLPLSRLTLSIDGGSRALLASPLTCGSFPAVSKLESYAGGPPARPSSTVVVGASPGGGPCPSATPFSPSLITSASSYAAGKPTTIAMTLSRRPGEQLTRRFVASLPVGMSAGLGGIETCSDAAAGSGACPAGSKMGEVVAAMGSGSPATLSGEVYAAGPYRGAPFSMVLALHAAIGPFDFGTSPVRTTLRVDPRNGRASVVTDPFPTLVEGLPVRIQSIGLDLDRSGALRNPTSCAPAHFDASVEADSGATAAVRSPYPLKGCRKLGLKPRFSLALTGRSQPHAKGRPGFQLTAHFRKGDANLRDLHMSFPPALGFDLAGVGEICPHVDAAAGLCSPQARVGTATARSSLLAKPLRGSVYIVAPDGHGLPELGIDIGAEGMHVSLNGRMSARHGRFGTNLVGMPDMPLSALTLHLRGGKRGVLSLGSSPCAHGRGRLTSNLSVRGQNGARLELHPRLRAHCV
jgi:hypothetical protein